MPSTTEPPGWPERNWCDGCSHRFPPELPRRWAENCAGGSAVAPSRELPVQHVISARHWGWEPHRMTGSRCAVRPRLDEEGRPRREIWAVSRSWPFRRRPGGVGADLSAMPLPHPRLQPRPMGECYCGVLAPRSTVRPRSVLRFRRGGADRLLGWIPRPGRRGRGLDAVADDYAVAASPTIDHLARRPLVLGRGHRGWWRAPASSLRVPGPAGGRLPIARGESVVGPGPPRYAPIWPPAGCRRVRLRRPASPPVGAGSVSAAVAFLSLRHCRHELERPSTRSRVLGSGPGGRRPPRRSGRPSP